MENYTNGKETLEVPARDSGRFVVSYTVGIADVAHDVYEIGYWLKEDDKVIPYLKRDGIYISAESILEKIYKSDGSYCGSEYLDMDKTHLLNGLRNVAYV